MAKDAVADPIRSYPKVAMVSIDRGPVTDSIGAVGAEARHPLERVQSRCPGNLSKRVHQTNPDPRTPRCFLDLKRTREVVRGLGHSLPVGLEFGAESNTTRHDEVAARRRHRQARLGRPKRLVRSVLASRKCAEDFGPMVHQAAWDRNFCLAER
jgi:hypothetical protein